ncbi:MAG TPA: hypothetical protein VMT88_05790 [Actinomycetes bacterium]|nr:hypothetical protein [Actinomycetes bacterium]
MHREQLADPVVDRRMWHITVTVAGAALDADEVRAALERLSDQHQFLLSARYSDDRAEVRYWDEGTDVRNAAARALLLWSDYGELAALPPWDVVGLEVVDQPTFQARGHAGELTVSPVGHGGVRPF